MPKKNILVFIIVLSTVFGLFAGVVGAIIARAYLFEDAFNLSLFGELSFLDQRQGSNIVIRDAKKVVVEQNVKVDEIARASKESLIWIYEKNQEKDDSKEEKSLDIKDRYLLDSYLSQGLVLTSDGWIVTEFLPQNIKTLVEKVKSTSTDELLKEALAAYVAIDSNGVIYDIKTLVNDEYSGFTYYKIDSSGLPVKQFSLYDEISSGRIVLVMNARKQVWLTNVSGMMTDKSKIKFSDFFDPKLLLNERVEENFYSSFIFDINGSILGIINKAGVARPISNFVSCINCLLENGSIERPALGAYYIDLSAYASIDAAAIKKGALISKNEKGIAIVPLSSAEKAGLKEGDIITAINGQFLDATHSLSFLLSGFKAGDTIGIEYQRDGKSSQLDLLLGERK